MKRSDARLAAAAVVLACTMTGAIVFAVFSLDFIFQQLQGQQCAMTVVGPACAPKEHRYE